MRSPTRPLYGLLLFFLCACTSYAGDTLRGGNGPFRKTWDVLHYDLDLDLNLNTKTLSGKSTIRFRTGDAPVPEMQLDLQEPLVLHRAVLLDASGKLLSEPSLRRVGAHYFLKPARPLAAGAVYGLRCDYSGIPREAPNPPWDGGLVWKKAKNKKPWVAVACQGDGASLWFPCKDLQSDEPDSGVTVRIRNSENLPVISNGKLLSGTPADNPVWQVKSSINPYNITFYIGDYVGWTDTFPGVSGKLPLSFYCLRGNEAKARRQFAVVPQMLRCYEEKVGPYPFYTDGYKLVEAPYLGMEHQSAVAYGNQYKMGYLGRDRSGTGVGKTFDYILVHESGHEWFGNSITAADVADNWIHEGFTTYLENVFVECVSGKKAALKYLLGERQNIAHDRPIIGQYGVFDEGSGDKYDKGAAIIGMLRAMEPSDESFWKHLREMYQHFAHRTITSAQMEAYWATALGRDLQPFFDQYLRTAALPELEIRKEKGGVSYARFASVVKGFSLPLFYGRNGGPVSIGEDWQRLEKDAQPRPEFLLQD